MSNADPVDGAEAQDKRIHQKVVVRNRALRYIHKQLLLLTLLSTVMAGIAITAAVIGFRTKQPPQYIALTEDGRVLPLIPLNKPSMDASAVNEFALSAVRAINTFDYINWRNQFPAIADYFTPKSWDDYMTEIDTRKTLTAIQERRMVVTPNFQGAPQVTSEGLDANGNYTWQVEMQLRVDYRAHVLSQNGGMDIGNRQEGKVILTIQRVSTAISASGVAIKTYQFIPNKRDAATDAAQPATPSGAP